jgi:hypothetical protein
MTGGEHDACAPLPGRSVDWPSARIPFRACGDGRTLGHENGHPSSRLILCRDEVSFPDEGQFSESLTKLLFACHGATQPQLRGRGGTYGTKAMCWSVERAGLGLANRSGKFFSGVAVIVHGGTIGRRRNRAVVNAIPEARRGWSPSERLTCPRSPS